MMVGAEDLLDGCLLPWRHSCEERDEDEVCNYWLSRVGEQVVGLVRREYGLTKLAQRQWLLIDSTHRIWARANTAVEAEWRGCGEILRAVQAQIDAAQTFAEALIPIYEAQLKAQLEAFAG